MAYKYKTYYETGSLRRGTLKHHVGKPTTRAKAIKQACALSKRTRGFVTVVGGRWGLEVASCVKGKRA